MAEQHGPAVPSYIFRGHEAAIHALHFYDGNRHLASGDSDGWVVVWSLSTRRPVAVWKGHQGGVLQIRQWTNTRLISHGRDHKLRVWQVRPEDFVGLSTKLPSDRHGEGDAAQPWLLHSLDVSALSFCAFSSCDEFGRSQSDPDTTSTSKSTPPPQLICAPNGLDSGGIDIFQLPSEARVSQIPSDKASPTGMVMSLCLFSEPEADRLVLVSGYEDGRVTVHTHPGDFTSSARPPWQRILLSKPHSQPVLSVDRLASGTHFISSSADAIVAKFQVPSSQQPHDDDQVKPEKVVNTKHAGQQGLSVRDDGKIFATAGWDTRVRVYSTKTLAELAVLKWHKVGCYATAFAEVNTAKLNAQTEDSPETSSSADLVVASMSPLDMIKAKREDKARSTHWLAAGGKDGKISLWDIY